MSDLTLVDNHIGLAVNVVCPGDRVMTEIVLRDNKFYGDSISPGSMQNVALVIGGAHRVGKPPHSDSPSQRPHYKIKKEACWNGKYTITGNQFIDYEGSSNVIELNPYAADMVTTSWWRDNEFVDVDDDGFGYFMDPKSAWANPKDCGEFPCTAPAQVLMLMSDTTFSGTKPSFHDQMSGNFQLIADNAGFAPYVPTCDRLASNNMYVC